MGSRRMPARLLLLLLAAISVEGKLGSPLIIPINRQHRNVPQCNHDDAAPTISAMSVSKDCGDTEMIAKLYKCCGEYDKCLLEPLNTENQKADSKRYQCGKAQWECVNYELQQHNELSNVCRKRTNDFTGLALDKTVHTFMFDLTKVGMKKELLYASCRNAKVWISKCAEEMFECVENRDNRKQDEDRSASRELRYCETTASGCLKQVTNYDRSLKCSLDLGFELGRLSRIEEQPEPDYKSMNPFEAIFKYSEKTWGMHWGYTLAFLVLISLLFTLCCCGCCYMVAVASLRKQKEQRFLKRMEAKDEAEDERKEREAEERRRRRKSKSKSRSKSRSKARSTRSTRSRRSSKSHRSSRSRRSDRSRSRTEVDESTMQTRSDMMESSE